MAKVMDEPQGEAAELQECYPMAKKGTRDGKEYFGELSCWTKTMATASTFGIYAFRYFKTGYMKIFYTDDYPRASLSVMSAALVFSTLLSLFVEPLLAWLSDNTRTLFGRDWGRRKPFLFMAALLVPVFNALSWAPPTALSFEAQQESESWYALSSNQNLAPPTFSSFEAAVWYGVFHILVRVVGDPLHDTANNALVAELTPDYQEKTSVWSFFELWSVLGMLFGMVTPILGESECASTPETGCYFYLQFAVVVGVLFSASTLLKCWLVKERAAKTLEKEPASLVASIVSCFKNYPYSILVLSDMVEGFGANLPMVVLPYILDWVVGKQAAEDLMGSPGMLFAACVVGHMVVRIIATPVWKSLANRYGKFELFVAFNIFYGLHMFLFLMVGQGSALLAIILCATWGTAYAGHWLLRDITSDVLDYDELLTGHRHEAQFLMALDLVPRICEVPADALPFLLMSYYGYNPDLPQQPESVQWVIRMSFSVVPGLAGIFGTFVLYFFKLRNAKQHAAIVNAVIAHQQGQTVVDPLTGLIMPPIKRHADNSAEYEGRVVGAKAMQILEHFFASEINAACAAGDVGKLVCRPVLYSVIAFCVAVPGVAITVAGWPAMYAGDHSWAPIGMILIGFAVIALAFNGVRLRQALLAKSAVTVEDLKVLVSISRSRGLLPGGVKGVVGQVDSMQIVSSTSKDKESL